MKKIWAAYAAMAAGKHTTLHISTADPNNNETLNRNQTVIHELHDTYIQFTCSFNSASAKNHKPPYQALADKQPIAKYM